VTGSVRTLSEAEPPRLEEIRGRRKQLLGLLLLVFVLLGAGLVVFSYAAEMIRGRAFEILDVGLMRSAFVALALAFALYVWEKERMLARTEHDLIEERVLSTALQNRVRELTAISRASRAVSSVLSLRDVLTLILESARDLLGATEGSVMLLDQDKRNLRLEASVGLGKDVTREIPVGEGVAGWVAEFREPVVLTGAVADPRFRRFVPKHRPVRSAMSAPLYARAEPVGVLNISVSRGERTYTQHDLRALTVFAEHAAIAIANARLFERERQTLARLEEADERRREFLALVTHDLKTPLTAILGYIRLLRDPSFHATPEQVSEFTGVIESQSDRMLEMIEQLIMSTSVEEGTLGLSREPLDLRAVVDSEVTAFRGVLRGRTMEVRVLDDLPSVFGDRTAVEHMLANLLDNAVKYSPDGSRILIECAEDDGEVRVIVSDQGPGIPPESLPYVFDRYRRASRHAEGASVGLGLFIVRSLAEGQGGRVWAENGPDGGARMTFTLPLQPQQAPELDEAPAHV
jgi:two-component system sensor histidine kinase KdpD